MKTYQIVAIAIFAAMISTNAIAFDASLDMAVNKTVSARISIMCINGKMWQTQNSHGVERTFPMANDDGSQITCGDKLKQHRRDLEKRLTHGNNATSDDTTMVSRMCIGGKMWESRQVNGGPLDSYRLANDNGEPMLCGETPL